MYFVLDCSSAYLFTHPVMLAPAAFSASGSCSDTPPEESASSSVSTGWSPCTTDSGQWLEVDLGANAVITSLETLGSTSPYHGWMRIFQLYKRAEWESSLSYVDEFSVNPASAYEFSRQSFDPFIFARFVRVVPISWADGLDPIMRWRLTGCYYVG